VVEEEEEVKQEIHIKAHHESRIRHMQIFPY
jgi:hypothetical protein